MTKRLFYVAAGMLLMAAIGFAQRTGDPFPEPIPATDRVIAVKFVEFATIPDSAGPAAAPRAGGTPAAAVPAAPRIMTMLHEPGTRRFFVSDMNGKLYAISNADNLPKGGQDSIRRILLNDNGTSKTLLQVIKEKNAAQGRMPATRADLRFAEGPDGQIFVTNKRDGIIRMLVP